MEGKMFRKSNSEGRRKNGTGKCHLINALAGEEL
jgi:hypothetical protein